jgi:pyruvate formate lyase activating enzyme
LILYDLKVIDAARHRRFTGLSNQLILDNLRRLADAGKHVIIRRPVIPGCNDDSESIHALARVVKDLSEIDEVHLLPYHRLGESKYKQLSRDYPMGQQSSLNDADVEKLRDILISYDLKVNIGG